jgi:hypothetical protein
MALIRPYMTISLDGYVTGPHDSASSTGLIGATTPDRAGRCSPS